jgi:hypothetical protein
MPLSDQAILTHWCKKINNASSQVPPYQEIKNTPQVIKPMAKISSMAKIILMS